MLVGEDHRVDAVAQAELHEDVAHVRLDGVLGDHELGRDLGVRQAPGKQAERVALAGGEAVERRSAGCSRTS